MFKPRNAFQSAKANMGLVMLFTLINFGLFLFNLNLNFPFSLFTPWLLGIWTVSALDNGLLTEALLYGSLLILIFGAFLGSFLVLRKRPKMMLLGLIVYIFDTIIMIYIYSGFGGYEWVINGLFHVWIIASMGYAIMNLYKTPINNKPLEEDKETENDHERL